MKRLAIVAVGLALVVGTLVVVIVGSYAVLAGAAAGVLAFAVLATWSVKRRRVK